MHFAQSVRTLSVLLTLLSVVTAAPQNNNGNNGNNNNNNNQNQNQGNNNGGDGGLTLDSANVQDASASDGDPDATEGQAASETDAANFINFCSGKTITNGAQVQGGSCNGIGKPYSTAAPLRH